MSAAAAPPIGKAVLAQELGWSRPTLDRRLKTDAAFPVVQRGDQSGGWQFDLAAVKQHLGLAPAPAGKKKPKATSPAVDQAQLRDAVKLPPPAAPPPRKSAHHHGEATARQRKDAADAALRENKLRLENAELVEMSDLRQRAIEMFAGLANDFDGMPEAIIKALQLGDDKLPAVQDIVDRIRVRFVAAGEALLGDE